MSVLVIGEPGCTAQGDYATMVRLLETAKACGCDVWKPQFVSSAARHLVRRAAGLNTDEAIAFYVAYADPFSWLEWPVDWHKDFRARCHDLGMEYACSVCIPEDVPIVAPFVDYLKIASFEVDDPALTLAVEATDRRVIASYGMSTEFCSQWEFPLHCVSAYPAPLEAMNLRVLGDENYFYGISDHSREIITGAVAVACGANMVEAHYRLDDCDPANPDYAVAFSPSEFAVYIDNIRKAEIMLGDGVKRIQPCEEKMLKYKVTA